MKIGVILGSVRTTRLGEQVAAWAMTQLTTNPTHEFELVDLKSFNLPIWESPMPPMMLGGKYDLPSQQAWGDKIAEFDALIFVTPEYNHGIPGALKNAIDSLGPELTGKPVGFISYSYDGGIRVVEQLRSVLANFSMHDVRAQVSINLNTDFRDGTFEPGTHHGVVLSQLMEQLTA
ncbi:NADPH-dependent FMN reductase [Corynebacterium epidermidicanis]|uniref:Putative flavoprotein n=1 Tax=Corynebacterium epidermidicanis TaxID=1050174 RepID=A0A0G3GLM2_9CORY|nr:NAD(P)H-dependent oxidoreductase [Corynebacterium epidermidicanis]AKK02069.1 putative flavoprotein [Corynebacterium epidermidicanis]